MQSKMEVLFNAVGYLYFNSVVMVVCAESAGQFWDYPLVMKETTEEYE